MMIQIDDNGKVTLHEVDSSVLDNFDFKYHLDALVSSLKPKPEKIKVEPKPNEDDVAF